MRSILTEPKFRRGRNVLTYASAAGPILSAGG
jgi:hypothetical protein